ncbi:MAG TPA: DUF4097 family beta strand repeat-containing protein [Acidobacteriota bacterium]|nr:DUF4097 family beta strand repeat-containing protein [Acidobacteriota bacterium]
MSVWERYRGIRPLAVVLAVSIVLPVSVFGAQVKEFRKAAQFDSGGRLILKIDHSTLRLESWDQNQVEVFARIEPQQNVSEDYARQAVEATRIEVTGDARSLSIETNFDDVPYRVHGTSHSRSLPHVNLEIHAPHSLQLRLDGDRSDVSVYGIDGNMDFETDRTKLETRNLAGKLRLKMDRGSASISGLRGSLDVEGDRTDMTFDNVQIDGNSRIDTQRGNIELRIPPSQGLSVHASTGRREQFHRDLPLTMQVMNRDRIEGTINGGGPDLVIRTQRGKFSLKRD